MAAPDHAQHLFEILLAPEGASTHGRAGRADQALAAPASP